MLPTMWEHYRKYWMATQIMILVIAAVMLYLGANWRTVLMYFLIMQVWAVLGAAWATRMKRRITARREGRTLPPL
jgi:drug/metabolite transporter (DMT)-like permease